MLKYALIHIHPIHSCPAPPPPPTTRPRSGPPIPEDKENHDEEQYHFIAAYHFLESSKVEALNRNASNLFIHTFS